MIIWDAKDQADVRPYGINWAPMLVDGDTIASASLVLVEGAVIDSQSNTDTMTLATISGGTNGRDATFTATLVTVDGKTFKQSITLPILSSACENYQPASTTKRTLVAMGFEECGLPGYEFEASPEEITSAVRRLDAMMREWEAGGIRLGYNFPDAIGNSDPDDESLIPDYGVTAVAGGLAEKMAPGLGKTLSPAQKRAASRAKIVVQAKTAVVPEVRRPRTTPRGTGNRYLGIWQPYIVDAVCC